nr:retrovirus-related Pol polyprotein from transposon TNT 1-94 [Tanacetum cinerariifolium]
MVAKDDEMSKEKEIDKIMALISLSFKKIFKPTNNNLKTSSNISRANQDNNLKINKGIGDDIDNEPEYQELEAHYLYMAQIQEVTLDVADNSGHISDVEPLQKEYSDTNITIDSLDMNNNGREVDQDEDDDLARERDLLASLIDKLKCEIDDIKNCNKLLESLSKTLVDKLKGTVKFENDKITPILGYGDLVQGNVTIKRVYYIEGLNNNLFSVGQVYDADLEVSFWKSTCYIRDLKGNDLLTCSRGIVLYLITLQDTSTPNPICLMAKASSSHAWLWQLRLSHLNFDTINLLWKYDIVTSLPKLKFVKDHLCSFFVSKSSAVTAADTPDQRQQHNTTPSTSITVDAYTPSLNIQTILESTSQAPTQAPTVTSTENINQAETQKENAKLKKMNLSTSSVHRTRRQLEIDSEMCMFALTMNKNEGIMLTKVELTLEESQHGVSDDHLNIKVVLFSIHSDDRNPSSVNIKQHCDDKATKKRWHDHQDPPDFGDKDTKKRKRKDFDTSSAKEAKDQYKSSKDAKALSKPSTTKKVMDDVVLIQDDVIDDEEFIQTKDLDWFKKTNANDAPKQNRFNELVKAKKDPKEFGNLMGSTTDFP